LIYFSCKILAFTQTETETETETKTQTKTGTKTQTETKTETKTQTETKTEAIRWILNGSFLTSLLNHFPPPPLMLVSKASDSP
jgi:carbohydrate-binding DOMON domain-containing protein